MQNINIPALIESIKNNNLSEDEKNYLIELLNNNDIEGFLKRFLTISKLGIDLLKLMNVDLGDFHLH